MSEVRIYQPGDHIDVSTGGILLRGGLSKLDKKDRKDVKMQSRRDTIMDIDPNKLSAMKL